MNLLSPASVTFNGPGMEEIILKAGKHVTECGRETAGTDLTDPQESYGALKHQSADIIRNDGLHTATGCVTS
jgi:hypothetical protein